MSVCIDEILHITEKFIYRLFRGFYGGCKENKRVGEEIYEYNSMIKPNLKKRPLTIVVKRNEVSQCSRSKKETHKRRNKAKNFPLSLFPCGDKKAITLLE